jgi:inner membrane protein
METSIHIVLGAVTAQMGFRNRIGREAAWAAAGIALLPDLDMLATPVLSAFDKTRTWFDNIGIHRSYTHSIFLIPIYGLLIAGAWWWLRRRKPERRKPFRLLYLCTLAALFNQPLLDVITAYGTQILLPFTHLRVAIPVLPIYDIIFEGALVLTLVACFVTRKATRGLSAAPMKIAWAGFLFCCAYIAAGFCINQVVLHQAKAQIGDCGGGAEFHAYPQMGTIFVWRVTRRCPDNWYATRANLLYGVDFRSEEHNEAAVVDNEWVEKARHLPQIQRFGWFALGQLRAAYSEEDGKRIVDFYDMRYAVRADELESFWHARVTFDAAGKVLNVEHVQRGFHRGDIFQTGREMLRDIWRP